MKHAPLTLVPLALAFGACSSPEPDAGRAVEGAGVVEAAVEADASLSAVEVAGTWEAAGVRLVLDADGGYTWSRIAGEEPTAGLPPLSPEGRWTLHAAAPDAAGTPRARALRLGPDGTAGTLVPILGSPARPLLELVPGALELARQ